MNNVSMIRRSDGITQTTCRNTDHVWLFMNFFAIAVSSSFLASRSIYSAHFLTTTRYSCLRYRSALFVFTVKLRLYEYGRPIIVAAVGPLLILFAIYCAIYLTTFDLIPFACFRGTWVFYVKDVHEKCMLTANWPCGQIEWVEHRVEIGHGTGAAGGLIKVTLYNLAFTSAYHANELGKQLKLQLWPYVCFHAETGWCGTSTPCKECANARHVSYRKFKSKSFLWVLQFVWQGDHGLWTRSACWIISRGW